MTTRRLLPGCSARLQIGLWVLAAVAVPCFGQITTIDNPVSSYTGSTAAIPIVGVDNVTQGSTISDGTLTLTFSTALDRHTVPGGGWSTWNTPPAVESTTPRVLGTYSVLTTETITLSTPYTQFGFELEPDTFSTFSISVAFMNGSTTLGTITRTVNGNAGALLFAASSPTPITSVVITAPSGANGFAIAQLRYGTAATAVPALGTWGMAGLAMLLMTGGVYFLMRRQESNAL